MSEYKESLFRMMNGLQKDCGSVQMQFLTTVNVTAVKLFGTATRGEKIDLESYTFEGWKNTLLKVFTL